MRHILSDETIEELEKLVSELRAKATGIKNIGEVARRSGTKQSLLFLVKKDAGRSFVNCSGFHAREPEEKAACPGVCSNRMRLRTGITAFGCCLRNNCLHTRCSAFVLQST